MKSLKTIAHQNVSRNLCFALGLAVLALAGSGQALAADKLVVGKVVPHPWTFIPVDVAEEQGIWKKNNLDVEIIGLGGSAKLAQALAANSVDVGIGSGPGMGFIAKGAPEMAVAAMAGQPLNMAIVVLKNSKLYPKGKGVKDLKGAKIGVSTPSSLTYFLTTRLAFEQGWGVKGITPVPLGRLPANVAAAKAGNTDGFVMSIDVGLKMEEKKTGRVFLRFGDYVTKFHTHVLFATNKLIKAKPDVVRRFLKGWFQAIAHMRANKAATVKTGMRVAKLSKRVSSAAYDRIMPMFSDNGRFDKASLEVVAEGLVVTKIFKKKPDMSKLYTEKFLPK